jgi:hypothetical protein
LLYTLMIAKNRHSPTERRARWGNATQARRKGSLTAAALDRDAGQCGTYEPEADIGSPDETPSWPISKQ